MPYREDALFNQYRLVLEEARAMYVDDLKSPAGMFAPSYNHQSSFNEDRDTDRVHLDDFRLSALGSITHNLVDVEEGANLLD